MNKEEFLNTFESYEWNILARSSNVLAIGTMFYIFIIMVYQLIITSFDIAQVEIVDNINASELLMVCLLIYFGARELEISTKLYKKIKNNELLNNEITKINTNSKKVTFKVYYKAVSNIKKRIEENERKETERIKSAVLYKKNNETGSHQ